MSDVTQLYLNPLAQMSRTEITDLQRRLTRLETQELATLAEVILRSILTAKGDLITATASNTPVVKAIGTNGQLLIADSAETTGLRWGSPTASIISDFTEAAQDAVGGALTDSGTIDFTYNDAANTITAIVIDGSISNAKLRNSAALSVIGRSANTTGEVADIVAANDGEVLRRSGTSIGFGVVANAGLANMAESRIKGRAAGAGTGAPTDLTPAQASTIVHSVALQADWDIGSGRKIQSSRIEARDTSGLLLVNSSGGGIFVQDSTGFVGLGQSSPAVRLHVGGGAGALVTSSVALAVNANSAVAAAIRNSNASVETAIIASSSTGSVGTSTNHPLEFRINNTERARLDTSGNLGISSTAPQALLHVGSGSGALVTGSTVIAANVNGGAGFALRNSSDGVEASLAAGTSTVGVGSRTNHPFTFFQNNSEAGRIDTSGNWGIGTTSPVTRMHVQASIDALSGVGTLSNYHLFLRHPVSTNSVGVGIAFGVSGVTADVGAAIVHERTGGNDQGNLRFYIKTSTSSGASPALAMIINQAADVGIGTDSPLAMTQVQSSRNALTDVSSLSNYHLLLRHPSNTTNGGVGVAFNVSSATADVGAAIVHERVGTNNQGNLRFYVKTSTSSGAAPTLAMIISHGGNIGINNASPGVLLHVGAGSGAFSSPNVLIGANAAGAASIAVRNSTNSIEGSLHATTAHVSLGSITNHPLMFFTNNTERGRVSGAGIFQWDQAFRVQGGTSGSYAVVGGVKGTGTSTRSNSASGSYGNLEIHTIEANTLTTNGDSIWFEFSGVFESVVVHTKQLRFVLVGSAGTSSILDVGAVADSFTGMWTCRGRVFRDGSAQQRVTATFVCSNSALAPIATDVIGLTNSFSSDMAVHVQVLSGASNAVRLRTSIFGYDRQGP